MFLSASEASHLTNDLMGDHAAMEKVAVLPWAVTSLHMGSLNTPDMAPLCFMFL